MDGSQQNEKSFTFNVLISVAFGRAGWLIRTHCTRHVLCVLENRLQRFISWHAFSSGVLLPLDIFRSLFLSVGRRRHQISVRCKLQSPFFASFLFHHSFRRLHIHARFVCLLHSIFFEKHSTHLLQRIRCCWNPFNVMAWSHTHKHRHFNICFDTAPFQEFVQFAETDQARLIHAEHDRDNQSLSFYMEPVRTWRDETQNDGEKKM